MSEPIKRIRALPVYAKLAVGSNKIHCAITNDDSKAHILSKGTVIANVSAANRIPPIVVPEDQKFNGHPLNNQTSLSPELESRPDSSDEGSDSGYESELFEENEDKNYPENLYPNLLMNF